jgi:nicotinamidase-related amidase
MDRLTADSTLLLFVDIQERLASAMPPEAMDRLVKSAGLLLAVAQVLKASVVASEQYPKGLGPTVAPLAARLRELGVHPIDKVCFDAMSEPRIGKAIAAARPRAVVVAGMEAHVCVFQTARELVRRGYATYVVADAVASRTEENRRAGLALCEKAGAVLTVAEAVSFDLVERAGTDAFKAVSKLVK